MSQALNQPRIVWNGTILDFPNAVERFDHDWRPKRAMSEALSGASETVTLRKLDNVRCRLKMHDSLQFFRDCSAFWSYAGEGQSFSLSFDRYDRINTTVNAALAPVAEKVLNPLFNDWANDTDADDWAETAPASGSINRVEDLRDVYSGDDGLSITSGGAGNGFLDQTVTLATSTKYRLRVRAKSAAIHKTFMRVQNDSTGNYLQDDETWSGSTGVDNEPTFTTVDGVDFTTYEWEFTTEGSGTAFSVRVYLTGSTSGWANNEVLHIGEFSIKEKQKATLTTTDGIRTGHPYRIRQAQLNGLDEEIVIVDVVDSGTVVELSEPVINTYAATDIFRSVEHFPSLRLVPSKQPHKELPTLVYALDLRCVEHVT